MIKGYAFVSLALMLGCAPSWAATYSLIDLGVNTYGYGLNNSGEVAGVLLRPAAQEAAIWKSDGSVSTLGYLGIPPNGSKISFARAINDAGQATGVSSASDGTYPAFLYDPALGMQSIGFLNPPSRQGYTSVGFAINNQGQIAGYSDTTNGSRAMIWSAQDGMTSLGALPLELSSYARGISNNGEVVGVSYTNQTPTGDERAWKWTEQTGIVYLGFQGEAKDVNESGRIVGHNAENGAAFVLDRNGDSVFIAPGTATSVNGRGDVVGQSGSRAFLWSDKNGLSYLDDLAGASSFLGFSEATGINNRGDIIAFGFDSAFQGHAVLFLRNDDAVPESSSWAMMVVGFGVAGAAARRRKQEWIAA